MKKSGRLKRIELWNFQSHRHTVLELHPGVNVIQGPNDIGKSSVLRAVRSLIYFGSMFIRTAALGEDPCRVILDFEDGTIERFREEDKNGKLKPGLQGYILDGKPEEKLGRTLPEKLADFINMDKVEFDDGTRFSLNIAEQIPKDGPFLLGGGYSGQARVKILGSVTEQHLFDEGARSVNLDRKRAESETKTIEKLLKEAKDEKRILDEEIDYVELFDKVSVLRQRHTIIEETLAAHQAFLECLKRAKGNLDDIRTDRARLPSADDVARALRSTEKIGEQHSSHSALLRSVSERARALEGFRRDLGGLPDLHRVVEVLACIEDLRDRVRDDLYVRFVDAGDQLTSIRTDRSELDLQALRGILQRCEEKSLRYRDGTALLHRYGERRNSHDRVCREVNAHAELLVANRKKLRTALRATKLCPYAPFDVELQSSCRERLDV